MPLAVGAEFAGYTILRVLGAGGMGTVYLVQHPRLPRQDALKVLSADLTTDPQYRARFLREADVAAGLSHPNILGIHDRGECGEQFWIAIDFVRGIDAARLLRERYPRGMPVGLAMQIIVAVGSALDYADQRGLLHRDVKPANILIADPGSESQRVFLADFGIARRVDDTGLTSTNIAVGTVAYAAPEQLMGESIDGRADQYALACTAFHLLTGSQPYESPTAAAVIAKHVMAPPPLIGQRRPELASLEPVFARAMAKKPAERFPRCQDFTHALHRALDAGGTQRAPQPIRVENTMPAPDFVYGPSSQFPPTQAAPMPPTPQPPPRAGLGGFGGGGPQPSRKRRRVIFAGIGAVIAVIGVVLAIALTYTGNSPHPPAKPTETALPNTGPFTGTYTADFGPRVDVIGRDLPGSPPPGKETWALRSMCGAGGCVATAARTAGHFRDHPPKLVFDDVAGRWIAVVLATQNCHNRDTEDWEFVWLQPHPDGSMSGEWIGDSLDCYSKRNVTFTRAGDTDVASLPDPSAQSARVVSAAQGLHGVYHSTATMAGTKPSEEDFHVQTVCLRAGDRCLSRFLTVDATGSHYMFFANGVWTRNNEDDYRCSDGRTSHRKIDGVYPAPNPPQDPIMQLTGHGHRDESGSACISGDYEQVLHRTGD
jgi:tRNA A-37 threonylcarbamoyl transferase component Bud32